MNRRSINLLAGAFVLAYGTAASAATKISVALQDPSTDSSIQGMRIVPQPATAKAGQVTFSIANQSKGLVHEMLLIRPKAGDQYSYDAKAQRIVEDKLVKLVDTDDIQPGKSVTKTVTLKPGHYELMCNQVGHYMQGMHVAFDVHS